MRASSFLCNLLTLPLRVSKSLIVGTRSSWFEVVDSPLLWFLGKEFVLLAWASRPYPFRSAFGVSHAAPRNTTKRNNCGAASDTLSSAPFQTGRPGSR